MGYSPLKAGVAFLPFTVGIVVSADHRVQPGQPDRPALHRRRRHPDGRGRAVRLLAPRRPRRRRRVLGAATGGSPRRLRQLLDDILPFIMLMAFGMGAVFVPLTLTAVHHLRREDSGIGSGVLNTDAAGRWRPRPRRSWPRSRRRRPPTAPRSSPRGAQPRRPRPAAEQMQQLQGSRSSMVVHRGRHPGVPRGLDPDAGASAVIWIFLDVKHEELATDGPEGVHARLIDLAPITTRGHPVRRVPSSRSHPIARRLRRIPRERTDPDDVRRPRPPGRRDPDAPRRQAPLAPARRTAAARRGVARLACSARSRTTRARARCRRLAAALSRTRLERRPRPHRRRPLGPRRGACGARRRARRPARATRWARGWRCTSPTTRRWSASSGWRPGGRPRTPSTP